MSDLLRLGSISVEELFEARLWIQSALVRAACARATDSDLRALRENVALGEALHKAGRSEDRISVNIEFHTLLATATHNPVAIMVVRGLTDALRNLIRQVGSDPAPSLFSARRRLVDALETRDEDAAATAIQKILKTTMQSYQRLAAQHNERTRSRDLDRRVAAAKNGTTRRA